MVDGYAFAAGGFDVKKRETLSKIERFNGKKWETLKIEIPKKLYALCAILKDDTLHFVGGKNEKGEKTDSYFSIKTEELIPKNVGFLVFTNWIRKSGLKKYGKDVGSVVNKYVGAMDVVFS